MTEMIEVRCLKEGQLNLGSTSDRTGEHPCFVPVYPGDVVELPADQVSVLWMEPANKNDPASRRAFEAAKAAHEEKLESVRQLKALQDPRNQARLAAQETAQALAAVIGGGDKPRRGRPPKSQGSEGLSGLEN